MAEIGVIASVVGVAGAGAKLSMLLYEFASTVASARNDILSVGQDISIFCAVLQQVASFLGKMKGVRFSTTALDTTLGVVERCRVIFGEIDVIVQGLKRDKAEGVQSVSFVAKVKWTFKKSQVRLLMGTLDSMKVTLHLMLTTLELSVKHVEDSTNTLEAKLEEESDIQSVAESLIVAHQLSIERLEELESEMDDEDGVIDGIDEASDARLEFPVPGLPNENFRAQLRKRASMWLSEIASEYSQSRPSSVMSFVSDRDQEESVRWAGREPSLSTQPPGNFPAPSNDSRIKDTRPAPYGTLKGQVSSPRDNINQRSERNSSQPSAVGIDVRRQGPRATSSTFPNAVERWETLFAHWEEISRHFRLILESNSSELKRDPLSTQLGRQVTDLSAAGANLFHAALELQRLEAASPDPSSERWELLSAHWEGLTSFWIRRLEESGRGSGSEGLSMKLSRTVTDLSAAGANLFHAVVELQRLRLAAARRKKREQNTGGNRTEVNTALDVAGGIPEREKELAESLAEMKRELEISRQEARRKADADARALKELRDQIAVEKQKRAYAMSVLG